MRSSVKMALIGHIDMGLNCLTATIVDRLKHEEIDVIIIDSNHVGPMVMSNRIEEKAIAELMLEYKHKEALNNRKLNNYLIEKPHYIRSDLDVYEEYQKIKNKCSNLSRRERDWVTQFVEKTNVESWIPYR